MNELDITDTTRTVDEIWLDWAVDVLARWATWLAYEQWVDGEPWEAAMPDVGKRDFDRVLSRAEALLPEDATVGEFNEAYEYLKKRAESERVDE